NSRTARRSHASETEDHRSFILAQNLDAADENDCGDDNERPNRTEQLSDYLQHECLLTRQSNDSSRSKSAISCIDYIRLTHTATLPTGATQLTLTDSFTATEVGWVTSALHRFHPPLPSTDRDPAFD